MGSGLGWRLGRFAACLWLAANGIGCGEKLGPPPRTDAGLPADGAAADATAVVNDGGWDAFLPIDGGHDGGFDAGEPRDSATAVDAYAPDGDAMADDSAVDVDGGPPDGAPWDADTIPDAAGLDCSAPMLVYVGDVVIRDNSDLRRLWDYTAITGTVTVLTAIPDIILPNLRRINGSFVAAVQAGLVSLSFPCMNTVTGSFDIYRTEALETLNLPLLVTVGGDLELSRTTLTSIALPRLATVGGNLSISSESATPGTTLTDVDLPALETLTGWLHVFNHTSLTRVNLPLVTGADTINIRACPAVDELDLRGVIIVPGGMRLEGLGAIPIIDLPQLRRTGERLRFGSFTVESTATTRVRAPVLNAVWGEFRLHDNPDLTIINLQRLRTLLSSFIMTNNPSLSTCRANAVYAQLIGHMGSADISGNLPCP